MKQGKLRQGSNQSKGCWIRKERRLAIYIRDNFECIYCGRKLHNVSSQEITLDHLNPRSTGGTNESTNLITACKSCNSGRKDKPYDQYATQGSIERIEIQRLLDLNIELAKDIIRGYSTIEENLR